MEEPDLRQEARPVDGDTGAGSQEAEGVVDTRIDRVARVRVVARDTEVGPEPFGRAPLERQKVVPRPIDRGDGPTEFLGENEPSYLEPSDRVQVGRHLRESVARVDRSVRKVAGEYPPVEVEGR